MSLQVASVSLEMVAAVAHDMRHPHDAPALQLTEAVADVGAGDVEDFDDLIGIQGLRGDEQQRVNLGNRPVDPPPRPHLAPMQDELLLNG